MDKWTRYIKNYLNKTDLKYDRQHTHTGCFCMIPNSIFKLHLTQKTEPKRSVLCVEKDFIFLSKSLVLKLFSRIPMISRRYYNAQLRCRNCGLVIINIVFFVMNVVSFVMVFVCYNTSIIIHTYKFIWKKKY